MRLIVYAMLISFTHCLAGVEWTRQEITKSGDCAGRLSKKVSLHLEKKYGLHCCGAGLAMCGGPIRSIGLAFSTTGPVTLSKARRIMVSCINDMIAIANNDFAIQPYLDRQPFDVKSSGLIIYVEDSYGREIMSPHVGVVSVVLGKIMYCYNDPEEKIYPYLKVVKETYEEALEAIRNEDEANNAQS